MADISPNSFYKPEYVQAVDKYLKLRRDRNAKYIKQTNTTTLKSSKKKNYVVYGTKFKVKLPTMEGFAEFIGVCKKTLYNWAEKHEDFAIALERIKNEQKDRLINMGLAGTYNPTIAKLILSSNHGMRERVDATSGDKPISNNFSDEQVDRIAERIAKRKRDDGGTSGAEKSD